ARERQASFTQLIVHDTSLWYVLAPRRKAAIAAGLLRRQSFVWLASNHTKPSSPYRRTPANRSAIFADWRVAGAAPVSAISIGARVSFRTAKIVGPNMGAKFQDAP